LVGAEGREAFEARLEGALPLSEYLVQELGSQVDLAHADGRARFAESARPLVAKVPEGVFRELLEERLAEAIRLPAARLRELWGAGEGRTDGRAGSGAGPTSGLGALNGARIGGARTGRAGQSAGRGGLMRQAVMMLVHYPPIAGQLEAAELTGLEGLDEPGADILRALVADLRADPCASTGQLLERWRERPEVERFGRLAAAEVLVPDKAAALRELQTALDRMQAERRRRRFDELLERERDGAITPAERTELQGLLAGPTPS
jgi:DNA primase